MKGQRLRYLSFKNFTSHLQLHRPSTLKFVHVSLEINFLIPSGVSPSPPAECSRRERSVCRRQWTLDFPCLRPHAVKHCCKLCRAAAFLGLVLLRRDTSIGRRIWMLRRFRALPPASVIPLVFVFRDVELEGNPVFVKIRDFCWEEPAYRIIRWTWKPASLVKQTEKYLFIFLVYTQALVRYARSFAFLVSYRRFCWASWTTVVSR